MKQLSGPPGSTPPRIRRYLSYDPRTGRILFHCAGMSVSPPADSAEHAYMEEFSHYDGAHFWIRDGRPEPRPECSIRLSYTPNKFILILGGVPVGAKVHITGAADTVITQEADDGVMHLTFAAHGYYRIRCEVFPMMAFNAEVTL
jgi:hypothetical protein